MPTVHEILKQTGFTDEQIAGSALLRVSSRPNWEALCSFRVEEIENEAQGSEIDYLFS